MTHAHRLDGAWLLATLFALWGILGLRAALASDASALRRFPQLAIALLILATAYGLFKRLAWTLRTYVIWSGLAIAFGLVGELTSGTHISVVAVWGLLITAVYAAIGLYIRTNLPDAD